MGASDSERHALSAATVEVRRLVEAHLAKSDHPAPTAQNHGVNPSRDAGQTVGHLHLHLILRLPHDVPDPTGGIRAVIPGKANYRAEGTSHTPPAAPHARPLITGGTTDPLLPYLHTHLGRRAETR